MGSLTSTQVAGLNSARLTIETTDVRQLATSTLRSLGTDLIRAMTTDQVAALTTAGGQPGHRQVAAITTSGIVA